MIEIASSTACRRNISVSKTTPDPALVVSNGSDDIGPTLPHIVLGPDTDGGHLRTGYHDMLHTATS